MSKSYLARYGSRYVPQKERLQSDQVENSAGGFVWEVDAWTRLNRFLILGTEGGSYYASERKLTLENIQCIKELVARDGLKFVETVTEVSQDGRAPKNDFALYALASAISLGDKETRIAAGKALPYVARTGTHLYQFVGFAQSMRGWGRVLRKAVSDWYAAKPESVAYQAVKYRQREGWSHRDLLRLAHPKALSEQHAAVFDWITHQKISAGEVPAMIYAFNEAQAAQTSQDTAALIRTYEGLPREILQTEHLNDPEVWHAMLEFKMPMTALMRNLATMTRIGALNSKEHRRLVTDAFSDQETITKSRLHPLNILTALATYATGYSLRGQNTWQPKADIIDALDGAFYKAFGNVSASGKALMLALDVSGSMTGGSVAGSPLTPREASAAMALITAHVEDDVEFMAFATQFVPLGISRGQRLSDAVKTVSGLPFGGTDCALPMMYAKHYGLDFDAFVVYTDSETWAGALHPSQALKMYRDTGHPKAKLVVCGMVANRFSIADPNDAGMMDVVGFDSATPGLISDFVADQF
jgi:60 kDa SS-A/Ro ribonucleoprotein